MSYFEKEYENTLFNLSSECNIACNNESTYSICKNKNLPQDLGMRYVTKFLIIFFFSLIG